MDQDSLRSFWLHAQDGRLCPWEQAKALGLREASRELHKGKTNLPWIAARVTKVGGGHPGKSALHEFFKLVDNTGVGSFRKGLGEIHLRVGLAEARPC